jgi:predicted DNA-binding transcriptional regulator AlpA
MSPTVLPAPAARAYPDQGLWSPRQLAEFLGVSRRTVWTMVARGQLPPPLHISRNVVRWEADTLAEFIEQLRGRRGA